MLNDIPCVTQHQAQVAADGRRTKQNAAESYPTSEVRGSGLECQAATVQERPRGATLRPRSVAVAGRSYPTSEVRGGGQEETSCIQGQWRPGGDTSHPRSGAARRSHLEPEARGGDLEEPTQPRGQGRQPGRATQGVLAAQALEGQEELSHVEGQERWW